MKYHIRWSRIGINDWIGFHKGGIDNLPLAATDLIEQIQLLASPPTNARSFLVTDAYGRGTTDANGQAFKLQIFKSLGTLFKGGLAGFKFGFVDFEPLWEAMLGVTAPGYAAFGYTSIGNCVVNSSTTVGECAGESFLSCIGNACMSHLLTSRTRLH